MLVSRKKKITRKVLQRLMDIVCAAFDAQLIRCGITMAVLTFNPGSGKMHTTISCDWNLCKLEGPSRCSSSKSRKTEILNAGPKTERFL